jgi:hypothetical protein
MNGLTDDGCILPYYGNPYNYTICKGNNSQLIEPIRRFSSKKCIHACDRLKVQFGFPYSRENVYPPEMNKSSVVFKFDKVIPVKTMT